MESFEYGDTSFVERTRFHRIQKLIRTCRVAIYVLLLLTSIYVSVCIYRSVFNLHKLNMDEYLVYSHKTNSFQVSSQIKRQIENEGFHILLLSLFLILNFCGLIAVYKESFSLTVLLMSGHTMIFLLSFLDDNTYPKGLIFKLMIVATVQSFVCFFCLMRWRRVSQSWY